MTRKLELAAKKFGMEISTERGKVMAVGKEENINCKVVYQCEYKWSRPGTR